MAKPLFGCNTLLILTATLFVSCSGQSVSFRQATRATTIHMDEFDGEILRIAENARSTLNIFFRYLNMAEAGEDNFSIKYAFQVDANSGISAEQIWIGNIVFRNGRFYGIVASTPIYLTSIRRGDTVNFNVDLITDWMFTRNERIIGGHSIRYLLEQIPEGERTDGQRRTLQMFE
ncbi:MAG: DUF2314 domain-containing protein [Treponema sp.]|nr:DUF2314 domain-containing protein [Treponema sp.]